MEVKEIKTVVGNLNDFLEVKDGIFRLRSMVLDLAVSGLLTEQNENEGTGDDLYQEIKKAKERITLSKRVKDLPPVDNKEIPFEIPKNWKWVRLGQISNYGSPKKVSPKNIKEGTLVIELEDIEKDSGRLLQKKYYPDREVKSDRSFFDTNFILYGKLRPYLNKVIVTDSDGVCSTELVPLEMLAGCNPYYLQLALMSGYFVGHVNKLTYGVKMPRLGTSDGQNAPIPLPPIAEQKRIVERVEELMKLIDQLEVEKKERDEVRSRMAVSAFYSFGTEHNGFALKHLIELVKTPSDVDELEKSILSLAVSGKLTPQDPKDGNAEDLYKEIQVIKEEVNKGNKKTKPLPPITAEEILFEVPKSWNLTRLADVFDVRDGTHDTPKYVDEGFPLVTSKNLSSGKLDISNVKYISEKDYLDIKRRSEVELDDILFAMIGSIGNPVIVDIETEFSIKNVALFKYFNKKLTNPEFLLLYLKFAAKDIQDKSSGAVQSFVSLGYLRAYPFMLPPVNEQKRIVAKVNDLMELVQKLREVMGK